MRVGIISDTHNLLRPEVFTHFEGVEHILHAGDVGDPSILVELEAIAPVTAVWGNTDAMGLRSRLPEIARVTLAGVKTVVLHGQQFGAPTAARVAAGFPDAGLVVFGHSHRVEVERVGSVWTVNPGSAGPIRFGVAPTLVVAEVDTEGIAAEVIRLSSAAGPRDG
jgi:uncharacterized protein